MKGDFSTWLLRLLFAIGVFVIFSVIYKSCTGCKHCGGDGVVTGISGEVHECKYCNPSKRDWSDPKKVVRW